MGKRDRRNLTKRGNVWYFDGIVRGRRVKRSLRTSKLEEARERRDAVSREALAESCEPERMVPTFAEAARAALAMMDSLREHDAEEAVAATTARDNHGLLREDGPVLSALGHLQLDAIDAAVIRRFWEKYVVEDRRSPKTGENALAGIERVLRHARNRGQIPMAHKPVSEFSEQHRAERRTKRARAAKEARRKLAKHGVLTPEQVGALVAAARANGTEDYVVILLAVECGLRRGEVAGLCWGDVCWGEGEGDSTRAIEVRRSNSSGLGADATKSGRARRPHISRRLYRALRGMYTARWEPGPQMRVIKRNYYDLSEVTLRRALKRARLPSRTLQNLRATASSLLKSWGVLPEYVRTVIGHESEGVAAAHYDRLDFQRYREAERLEPGDTPMDLFERICPAPEREKSHHQSHHRRVGQGNAPRLQPVAWRPQRESNPCCRLERAES